MKKRVISVICMLSILFSTLGTGIPALAAVTEPTLIEESDIPLRLHYDEEAPYNNENAETHSGITVNDGWERWSLPIGNGYFGANVFGRTETERIQITEKTLSNPYYKNDPEGNRHSLGGLNNFSETYIDIGHKFSEVTDYSRWLDLKTAVSGVSYAYDGVTYTREVFTSYPDKALVIRLDASEAGKLGFVLRPTVPWQQEYAAWEGDGASKTGEVVSYIDGSDGVIELSGKMGYYDIDFLGLYRVVTNGGTVTATTCTNEYGNTDGTITVSGATSAYIYVTLGTDYELSSEMFTSSDKEKPTFDTDLDDTRAKVEGEANDIAAQLDGKSFEEAYAVLKNNHLNDYTELFGRVTLNLGDEEDASLTTDALLEKYKSGEYSNYLEALYFQYGRYLLIASSRPGTLVANLQGTWNRYNKAPWGSGIWHNINVQMNYWPAFSTNIAECFEAYVGYNAAYMDAAEANATSMVNRYNNSQLGADGGNGWCIGTGAFPYSISGDRSAGNLGFTTQLFWEYYQYTQDKVLLETVVFPILVSAARYIVKTVELTEDGKYLVSYCDSPEMYVNGVWYYTTGTTYAQSFAYQNNYNALLAAKEMGIDLTDTDLLNSEELCVFKRVMEQLDKYDPIIVGLSGQVKEFREEDYYASVADDPKHRHISQLVGLYPGNIINSNTPAWLDAAKVTLTERGDNATGWGIAHRLNLWARTKDGDRTYQVLNTLLKTSTATNLWDLHPPFQIDGNLGGTAGISEMLLQSHEGYIAPLAAIPTAWESGSYTGLVARGNFEVSAAWENGVATCFNITSNAGGDVSVSYGGITSAKVVRLSDGSEVDYKVSGTDLITFETEKDETYLIAGFKLSTKLSAPASLTVSRQGLGEINLSWDAVDGAVGYRVYTAIESQPDYTLVGNTTGTSAVYIPKEENINARMTFKVVPVNADGVEGKGAIAYQNPVDVNAALSDYEAYAFENGELQITLQASENTIKYKLWKMAEGESEYTLVTESPYPIIIHDGYNETDKYAVSLISNALRTESELYEISKIKNATEGADESGAVWYTNLLSGTTVEPNDSEVLSFVHPTGKGSYGYDKLTDGIYQKDESGATNVHLGRFATKDMASARLDGSVSFDRTYLLSELRLYDFDTSSSGSRLGDNITVYIFTDGEWTEAASVKGKSNVLAARVKDTAIGLYYVPIDLSGVKAEGIRIVCQNEASTTQGITLYEITCSGAALNDELIYGDNILLGKAPTASEHSGIHTGYDEAKLTDGSFESKTGRFAALDGESNYVKVEYDLAGGAIADTLRIYDFAENAETVSRTSSATVEIYKNGKWETVIEGEALLAPSQRLTDENNKKYTPVSIGSYAEKIRITLSNTASTLGVSIYEISLSGYSRSNEVAETDNILSGMLFTGDKTPYSNATYGTYGYDKLTDGDFGVHSGRFASNDETYSKVTFECDLGDVYKLYDLRIYDHADGGITRSKETTVEVYYNGEWVKLVDAQPLASGSDRLKDSQNKEHTLFALEGAKAEKIRITCYNSSGEKKGISIYEIKCSATRISENASYNIITDSESVTVESTVKGNILKGKTFVADSAATALVISSSYGYAKITDGLFNTDANGNSSIHAGRFAIKEVAGAYVDGTVDLGGSYALNELRIYDYADQNPTRLGDSVTVYVYTGTEWITAYTISGTSNIASAKKMDSDIGLKYLPVDLTGKTAEKIRVYMSNSAATGITFYEITCTGEKLNGETVTDNVSKTLSKSEINTITDGNKDTVLSLADGTLSYYLEFDLGQNYGLYSINIRDKRADTDLVDGKAASRSNDTYIELYVDGAWVRVVSSASLSVTEEYTSFELHGIKASKIRIGFNNTQTFDNGSSPVAMISEISVSVAGEAPDKKPLLNAYAALPVIADGDSTYTANMQRFKGYATEFMLSDADVAEYAGEMTAYNATLLNGTHTAHDIKTYDAKKPTCTESGWYAYEACELCDYTTFESILPTTHDASELWSKDETGHWKTCGNEGCEDKVDFAQHSYDSDCDAVCNVCGYERTAPHNFKTTYETSDTEHWIVCADCPVVKEGSIGEHTYDGDEDTDCDCGHSRGHQHNYNVANYDDESHWTECECGEKDADSVKPHAYDDKCDIDCACGNVRTAPHSYKDSYESDENEHWIICAGCGDEMPDSREEHNGEATCKKKAVCYTCEKEYGELAPHTYDGACDRVCNYCEDERTGTTAHTYQNSCDKNCDICREKREITHTYKNACDDTCDVCFAKRTPAAHTGGTATCTKRAVCTACGAEYGELAEHSYSTEWKYGATHHWHECSCVSKKDEAPHAFGEWTVKDGARTKSCICGYTVSDPSYKTEGSLPTGAIAAIVIGSVATVGAIGFGVYYFVFKKKKISNNLK